MSGADIRTASLVEQLAGLVAEDADAVALAQALDPELREIAGLAETCALLSRISQLSALQCDEVGRWFRLTQLEGWASASLTRKRQVLAEMVDVYRRRGTRWALERVLGVVEQASHYTVTEWWERTPPDPPYTYRVDAEVLEQGLSLDELRHLRQVLEAYVPARARLLELSESIPIESQLLCAGYPEVGLFIEVT